MRSALQAASANDKVLAERETEVADLKTQLADLTTAKETATELQSKVTALESEIETASIPHATCRVLMTDDISSKRLPLLRPISYYRLKKKRSRGHLMLMSRRKSEASSTSFKNFRQRMQSSRRNTRAFKKRLLYSRR